MSEIPASDEAAGHAADEMARACGRIAPKGWIWMFVLVPENRIGIWKPRSAVSKSALPGMLRELADMIESDSSEWITLGPPEQVEGVEGS